MIEFDRVNLVKETLPYYGGEGFSNDPEFPENILPDRHLGRPNAK